MDNITILQEIKQEKISNIQQRVNDNILEKEQANLLIRFIQEAKTIEDVHNIALLGVRAKKTGFVFNSVLEKKKTNKIHYFKKNKDLSFKTNENSLNHKLIIGDNYLALENLLIEYKNKIKVIYIDPPYGCNSMGEFAKTNYENNISRDNLLSMLKTRLELAKKLLADDGVIFCSIDDKNQAYVKILFDDIFGEENFVNPIIWEKLNSDTATIDIQSNFEYILCYRKNKDKNLILGEIKEKKIELIKENDSFYYTKDIYGFGNLNIHNRPTLGYTIYYNFDTKDIQFNYDNLEQDYNNVNNELIAKGYIAIKPPIRNNIIGAWGSSIEYLSNNKKDLIVVKKK